MEEVCYALVVRQRTCQSGVPLTNEKVYTNITDIDTIILDNGYVLNVSVGTNNSLVLNFVNSAFGINLEFKLIDATPKVFDLPIQNGTYRVGILLKLRCCCV